MIAFSGLSSHLMWNQKDGWNLATKKKGKFRTWKFIWKKLQQVSVSIMGTFTRITKKCFQCLLKSMPWSIAPVLRAKWDPTQCCSKESDQWVSLHAELSLWHASSINHGKWWTENRLKEVSVAVCWHIYGYEWGCKL